MSSTLLANPTTRRHLHEPGSLTHLRFAEFSKCHAAADDAKSCGDQKEDYIECLHHNKEVRRLRVLHQRIQPADAASTALSVQIARAMEIKKHYLTTVADKVADRRREAEQQIDSGILGLGLLNSGDKA